MCDSCKSEQDLLLEWGDGSQVICNHPVDNVVCEDEEHKAMMVSTSTIRLKKNIVLDFMIYSKNYFFMLL